MTYDITALGRKVLAVYPFFGSVATNIEYIETDDIEQTKNDGRNIYYNPGYLAGLSAGQQVFVLAHELCHIAFDHEARGEGKNKVIWDRATDAVINQQLKRDGLELVETAIDYPEAIDYDAEEYYEILMKEKMAVDLMFGQLEGQETPAAGQGGGELSPGGELSDDDDNESGSDQSLPQEETDEEDEEDIFRRLAAEQDDSSEQPGSSGEQQEDDDSDDDESEYTLVQKMEAKAGNSENRDIREVDEVGAATPLLDWRLLLFDTINYGVDWSYTNAILEDGIVRPVLEELPIPETEIVLDTSWSVDEELLRNFLRECKNILKISKLKAGCFDTVFYGFHDIRTEKDIEEMVFQGGGGTDFNVAAKAFTMRVDNRIVFTDGEAPMPDKYLDAIWVVYGDEKIEPQGGTVIHIRPEWLMKNQRKY